MENFLDSLVNLCVDIGAKLLFAGLILVIGFACIKAFVKFLRKSKMASKMDRTVASFFFNFVSIGLKVIVVVSAIGVMGVPMASVVTVLATAGAAVGLAMQGSLSNLAGGLMLLIFKPFRVEDYVESQGVSGTVEEISIMYTVLCTPDNKTVTLPNGALMNSTITNYSKKDLRRVDIPVVVACETDIDRVRDLLSSLASAHSLVLDQPALAVVYTGRTDDGLAFVVRAWTKKEDYWTVNFDLNETIKKAFDMTGIEVPYKQMDVRIRKD